MGDGNVQGGGRVRGGTIEGKGVGRGGEGSGRWYQRCLGEVGRKEEGRRDDEISGGGSSGRNVGRILQRRESGKLGRWRSIGLEGERGEERGGNE